jgi:peptidoglycan/xylan/chitin deacetylase (PgdA/CDA1 family)
MADLPAAWPRGRTIAVSVSVMLEGWSDGAAPGIGPMGNPLKSGVLDLQARSWADYGPNAGAWRLLDILAGADVRAVFYTSGIVAERHPHLMHAIAEAGHEIGGHGWAQEIVPATQSRDDETRDLERCIATLEAASGKPLRGWLSPRCTPSSATAELLATRNFAWHADYFDADLPRVLDTPGGSLVAVPFTMEVNDMPLSVRYGSAPEVFTTTFERIVTAWPAPDERPYCLDITVHAHIFGRPFGALEFEQTLAVARKRAEHVWLTDHATLAAAFAEDAAPA